MEGGRAGSRAGREGRLDGLRAALRHSHAAGARGNHPRRDHGRLLLRRGMDGASLLVVRQRIRGLRGRRGRGGGGADAGIAGRPRRYFLKRRASRRAQQRSLSLPARREEPSAPRQKSAGPAHDHGSGDCQRRDARRDRLGRLHRGKQRLHRPQRQAPRLPAQAAVRGGLGLGPAGRHLRNRQRRVPPLLQ